MKTPIKRAQLWIHHNYRWVLSAIAVFLGVFLMTASLISIGNQNQLISQVKDLSEQNRQLSEDNKNLNSQSKQIAEENQFIATQSRDYIRCLATVFAQYTHDFIPVTIESLDTCTVKSEPNQTSPDSRGTNSQPRTDSQAPSSSSSGQPSAPSSPPTPPPGGSGEPDNDGIIIDLPILPPVHIGSPL